MSDRNYVINKGNEVNYVIFTNNLFLIYSMDVYQNILRHIIRKIIKTLLKY